MSEEEEKDFIDKALHDLNHPKNKKFEKELSPLHKAMDEVDNMKIPDAKKSKKESWKDIKGKIRTEAPQQEKRGVIEVFFNPQQIRKVAAVAAVFVGIYALWFFMNGIQTISPSDGTLEYTFPDGSVAYLKKGSTIDYLKHRFDGNIYLNGHAQFHIKPAAEGGVSYEVKTDRSVIFANTGSSFDIRDDNFLYHLTNLGDEHLNVTSPHHLDERNRTIVQNGHSLKSTSKRIGNTFDLGTSHSSWPSGHFVYNEVPLKMVIKDFENQFGVIVEHEIAEIEDMLYTGSFKDEDITKAVASLCESIDMDFILEGEKVILKQIVEEDL
ncbi:DUF4974 domain-containing protein [Flammeovirga yaeyamensis]|uniref:DUF4974 domain-containing protein n=1 Tax=Flammeovirga yaeyamensis TaxID=367791 RepID=A0AAX1N763_9BACT|nr:FecR family protein [Flammeovirga yaeyamensis]MBB3699735.1 ferric-dicitrate binding protein FerR (iron transport regulator) [Flammeovirga yaeyamensis]NMF36695.1 FecR family protein [Flammeovirga yaeyamensis]QWG02261.1 DUF4974 domain-containing protein [Flammeovirga yaeyamensis]